MVLLRYYINISALKRASNEPGMRLNHQKAPGTGTLLSWEEIRREPSVFDDRCTRTTLRGRTMDAGTGNSVGAVRRSKEDRKVLRKQLKASHTLLKHEGIRTTPQPTKTLVVANGGLGNGVSREELSAALGEMGELETLIMHPHKPYAFVTYRSEESARKAHVRLNGEKLECRESSVTLYLSYVNSVTCEEEVSVPLPDGLVLVEDFVSQEEEAVLLAAIDWSSTNDDFTAKKALKHRKVKHYGFEFRYDNNNVDKDKPLAAGIPQECLPFLERCVKNKHIDILPDQLTVNQYESGQGIPPHVDTHSAFEDTILSLSLGAMLEWRREKERARALSEVLTQRWMNLKSPCPTTPATTPRVVNLSALHIATESRVAGPCCGSPRHTDSSCWQCSGPSGSKA